MFFHCWACSTSARLRRGFLTRRRGESGREERLPGLPTAAVTVDSAPERDFART